MGRSRRQLRTPIGQQTVIFPGNRSTPLGPFLNMAHFHVQNGGLERIHSVIISRDYVPVFGRLPPISEQSHFAGQLWVRGDHSSALPKRTEILSRVKAKTANTPYGPGISTLVTGTVRLRCIFNNG